MRLDIMSGVEGGAAPREKRSRIVSQGVLPPPLYIGGRGEGPTWRGGTALGLRTRVSPAQGLRQGGGEASRNPPLGRPPPWALFGPSAPSHLGLPSEKGPIDIKFSNLIPKPFRN